MIPNPTPKKLLTLSSWISARFERPPSIRTARRWCEQEIIPAKKIGKSWFVDSAAELQSANEKSVDDLVNSVLKAN